MQPVLDLVKHKGVEVLKFSSPTELREVTQDDFMSAFDHIVRK